MAQDGSQRLVSSFPDSRPGRFVDSDSSSCQQPPSHEERVHICEDRLGQLVPRQ
jgi:hypothetical protein